MAAEQIAFQYSYASVDSGDGEDPTARAEEILREERVLAASRGFDGDETVLLIPVTDAGQIVALDEDDVLRFDLSATRLIERFEAAGLTLHLGLEDDVLDAVDAELDDEFGDAFEQLDDPTAGQDDLTGFGLEEDDDLDESLFALEPVRVAAFSRRGPWIARVTAQLVGAEVTYLEEGTWSLNRYATTESQLTLVTAAAEAPVIEVNLPEHGDAWVEVTSGDGTSAFFWPNSERLTRPVLSIDDLRSPESAEVYRRVLAEADGSRDELVGLGLGSALDVEQAHRACMPEAVGGTAGEDVRLRAFITAFGVPAELVEAGLQPEPSAGRRFAPRGWARTAGDVIVAGIQETTPLTRRDRPFARLSRWIGARPGVGMAISAGEFAAGVALTRSRSRFGRVAGALMVFDAIADLVVWVIRLVRR